MELLHNVQVPAGDGPHPTIVVLHGWGASGHDLFGLAPLLHGGRALVISPQGTVAVPLGPQMPPGWGWFPLAGGAEADPEQVSSSLAQLRDFLDRAYAHYGADPARTILMGFSQGGVMAYQLALSAPERYAGLVAMSSWLPDELAKGVAKSEALAQLPILITHGTEDPMIPVERAYESRDRLLALGASPRFSEYPMQHEIRPEALRDIVVWLEEKVFRPVVLG